MAKDRTCRKYCCRIVPSYLRAWLKANRTYLLSKVWLVREVAPLSRQFPLMTDRRNRTSEICAVCFSVKRYFLVWFSGMWSRLLTPSCRTVYSAASSKCSWYRVFLVRLFSIGLKQMTWNTQILWLLPMVVQFRMSYEKVKCFQWLSVWLTPTILRYDLSFKMASATVEIKQTPLFV